MADEPTEFPRALGKPATRALAAQGVTRFDQLTGRTRAELLALHGVGPKGIRVLEAELEARGLRFADPQY
ncbi:helix-hairpin-helix domain-containing protein [Cellulomonas rhizosphaerae]|uniref:DNA-binding protein n=1 Tax=Cellulomonas rhizosphaerae TaxID=2293719 RepID=A0A413RMW6_9CELL|nr:hypothetical protein [Cellulomonas rhizosphaerae]RHA42702.1 hypothetical protein D1825_06880 [Cellulomonas rhizosphaerae]